jgi:hypothetical protein
MDKSTVIISTLHFDLRGCTDRSQRFARRVKAQNRSQAPERFIKVA